MRPEEFNEADVHEFFDKAMLKERSPDSPRYTPEALLRDATNLGFRPETKHLEEFAPEENNSDPYFDLNKFVPKYHRSGLAAREFAGPLLGDAQLFPLNALSMLVALGGVGKTSVAIAISAHVAAGKPWGVGKLVRRNVLLFSVEEDQSELDRKFSALVEHWIEDERTLAIESLRLISLKGTDPRLTLTNGREIYSSNLAGEIINAAKQFSADLIFLDHLQGLTAGDLNNSDTATVLAQVANQIVAETGAAVVFTAHTNKAHISATSVDHGFTTGSLAFENAARQVTGIVFLPDDDARLLGDIETQQQYLKMEMPKNSYGIAREVSYLKKELSPKFHTVAIKPYYPPIGTMKFETAEEVLSRKIVDYVNTHPFISKNKLDEISGKKRDPFRASKSAVRQACDNLLSDRALILKKPTPSERNRYKIPSQTKEGLLCVD